MITRRAVLAGLLAPQRRPNIVVFMTDDHGGWAWGGGGCRDIATPTLNRLASEGVQFTNAFAATPVCSPSRMTYLTGLLPSQHGVQDYLIPRDSVGPQSRRWLEGKPTWSEALASAGYTLGMTGKWHMGLDDQPQAGFSWWATVPGGGGTYRDPVFVRNGERFAAKGFKTDLVGDFALEFLDHQKDRTKPFALLVPFYAPHTPYDYQPEPYRAPYEGSSFPCFPEVGRHPNQNPGLAQHHGNVESKRSYSALVTGVDANVKRVLDGLDKIGAREDTLVVFTADQGYNTGHHGLWGKGNGSIPFNMYEESIRVPMVWNQPGNIRPGQCDALISSYDFFPTLLDYAGVPAPADSRRVGTSYASFVRGGKPRWRQRLHFEYCYTRAIRTSRWKWIERADGYPSELYDLDADAGETQNLAGRHKDEQERLAAQLTDFFAKSGAPPLKDWRSTTKQTLFQYQRNP